MPIDRNRRHLPRFIGVTALTIFALLFVGSIAMTVIVNLLPYVHIRPFSERLLISALLHLFLLTLAALAMTKAELSAPSLRGDYWRDALGIWGGFVMAIFFAAWLSANPLGLLVRIFPAEQVTREFVVVKAKREGSKYKSTALELSLPPSPQFYGVDLSKRVFGEIPQIQPGDRVKFELLENQFGAYVTRFEVLPASNSLEAGGEVGR